MFISPQSRPGSHSCIEMQEAGASVNVALVEVLHGCTWPHVVQLMLHMLGEDTCVPLEQLRAACVHTDQPIQFGSPTRVVFDAIPKLTKYPGLPCVMTHRTHSWTQLC